MDLDAVSKTDVNSAISTLADVSLTLASSWGLSVVGAIAVLVVGRWLAGAIRRSVLRALERGGVDATLVPFLSNMAYYLVLTIVVIAVLTLFGIETTSLIAVLGAASLAVGLALQGTLSNFSAGVMLLLFRPFKPGDFVEVAGVTGSVVEIGIFTTWLNTADNIRILVPNSSVYGNTLKNYSANDNRRVDLVVGISYDDDIGVAIDTLTQIVKGDTRVLADPAPMIGVAELADSSVNLVVRPWCERADYWSLRCDLTRAFKERLEAAGCSIPYPQQDVHLAGASEASS